MTRKFLAFLILPHLLFSEIVISKPSKTDKEETVAVSTSQKAQPAKPGQPPHLTNKPAPPDDDSIQPEPTTPNFIDPAYQKQFFRTLIFLCVLIIFAMIIVYVYKRASPMSAISKKNGRGNIKILERRSLSPQTYLYHVQVGDKQFILSESKVDVRNVSTLDWLEK